MRIKTHNRGGVIYVEKCLVIWGIIPTFVATYVVYTYM